MVEKYIKVKTSERLPSDSGYYHADMGLLFFSHDQNLHWTNHVEYWLEPIPDHESKLVEMLEEIKNELNLIWQHNDKNIVFNRIDVSEIESLIQKTKSNE